METRHTVATATAASLLAIAVVVAVGVGVSPAVVAQETNESAETDEASFGAQVSAFAQSTAADANGSLDAGMWAERVNDSENPADAVRGRTATLERRYHELQNRTDELEAARANGSISGVAYTARASALHAELRNLERHVNETSQVAREVGVDESKLSELRAAAGNATGPEMAAIARNITNAGQGPPAWAGPDGDGPDDRPDNGTAGPPDNQTGPPGTETENNSKGQPDETGGGSGNGPEGGPGNSGGDGSPGNGGGSGPGNGQGPPLIDLARVY